MKKLVMFLTIIMFFACEQSDTAKDKQASSAHTAVLQLILIGGPGAGKGTQAERLQQKYNLAHISTGQILRDAVAQGTPLGKQVEGVMQRGELVADSIILAIIEERLQQPDTKKGFILDGFPRTLAQAKGLEPILKRRGNTTLQVLLLEVSDEEMMERLLARGRADDTRETIGKRIAKFHSETTDAIEYYREKGTLIRINGEQPIDAVTAEIEAALKKQDP